MSADAAVLAIDIGGTKMAAGVVAADGTVRADARTDTRGPDADTLYSALEGVCRTVLASAGVGVSAIGVGCGGPMRFPEGIVSPLHIPQWRDFPLKERLERSFEARAIVDNDAKAFALGEWWRGAGRGSRAMLGMVVSTGVGGGLIVDGRLLDGAFGQAGHIGHVIVWPDGPPCNCGARGCLTSIASGTGIRQRGGRTAAEAAAAARAGDAIARSLFADAGTALARAIASATALLDLERVVLGGSVALRAWDLIGEAFDRELALRLSPRFSSNMRVHHAALADRAGIVGAAALVLRPR